jgi:hypothetical protein
MEEVEADYASEQQRKTAADSSYIRTPALSISKSVCCSKTDKRCCQNNKA